MQVNMSTAQVSLNSTNTTASSSLNSSSEFQDYVNKRMYEIQSETSVPVSGSETKTTDTSKTESDKKTDSTSKKDDTDKKTDKSKTDKKETNEEEVVGEVVNTEVEQVITDELLAMLTGVGEVSVQTEEVEVAVETGEIQVIDLKQAKLATNELTYEESKIEQAEVEIKDEFVDDFTKAVKTTEAPVEVEVQEEVLEVEEEALEVVETEEVETVVKNIVEEDEIVVKDDVEKTEVDADVEITQSTTTTLSEIAKEEEVVFIKVGDTKLDESWQKVMDNMAKEIIAKEAAGIDKFTVILNPEGLGTVKVEVLQQEGSLLVNLVCSQSGTANLLNDNLLGLAKLLESNFGDDSNVIVTEETEESGEREMNQEGSQKQEQEIEEVEEIEEIEIDFMERMRLGLLN